MSERAITPTKELPVDKAEATLHRLVAVGQYLYDVTNGDYTSGEREFPDPLAPLCMESIREAQRNIDQAIKDARRTKSVQTGGEMVLCEDWKL